MQIKLILVEQYSPSVFELVIDNELHLSGYSNGTVLQIIIIMIHAKYHD